MQKPVGLVSSDCYNKIDMVDYIAEMYFFTVPKARKSKIKGPFDLVFQ